MHLQKKWPVTLQANVEIFEVEHVKNSVDGVDLEGYSEFEIVS